MQIRCRAMLWDSCVALLRIVIVIVVALLRIVIVIVVALLRDSAKKV